MHYLEEDESNNILCVLCLPQTLKFLNFSLPTYHLN